MKAYPVSLFWSCLAVFGQTAAAELPDLGFLRKMFTEAVGKDFDLVKDVLDERPAARGGETYWLAHVKPKRSGRYTLTYTYRFTHDFSHPEEGESEILIAVGEANGHRRHHGILGLSTVCLGDTVIIPIRLDRMVEHQFSLASRYEEGKTIGERQSESVEEVLLEGQATHALEDHLRYRGTRRSVLPHRAAGAETVTYSAVFEAKAPGRFNLLLSKDASGKVDLRDGLPVLIVSPGTPITTLAFQQNTIHYSDKKRFSAHSGHQFLTRLLILQPGDTFTLDYSTQTHRWEAGETPPSSEPTEKPPLFIRRFPFEVDADVSYNAWLADYLPQEE